MSNSVNRGEKASIVEAIFAINPVAEVVIGGDDIDTIEWHNETPEISKEDIIAKQAELDAEYIDQKYQRDRHFLYPELREQLDQLWHAIDEGTLDKTSDFYTTLKKVKDDNPKPS